MKKIYLILLFLPLFGIVSCIKQTDCANAQTGKFIYLSEPEKLNDKTIVALFIPESTLYSTYKIIGTVPKKYQKTDTLCVNISLNEIIVKGKHKDYSYEFYQIKCIEMKEGIL